MTPRDRPDSEGGVRFPLQPTDQMIRAGHERLADLLQAGVGLAYAAEEVWLAMQALRPQRLPRPACRLDDLEGRQQSQSSDAR